MSSETEQRGHELVKKAEAALSRFSWFGLASANKYDDAIELYTKAANNFKMSQSWLHAAETYIKIADLETKAGSNTYETATNFVNAGDMYRKVDPKRAIESYTSGIQILQEDGRFGTAAKHCESIASLFEAENDLLSAIKYLKQAMEFYNLDNSPARANKNEEKLALLYAENDDFKQAFYHFSQLGRSCLESNLLKFNAKKHFFHGLLCVLARNDLVAFEVSYEELKGLDSSLVSTREGKLLEVIKESLEKFDEEKFTAGVYEFDQICKLDSWETKVLLKVKSYFNTNGINMEGGEGDADIC